MGNVRITKNLWPAIKANLSLAQRSYVSVGFPGDVPKSKAPHGNSGMNNVQIALLNEFGTAPGATHSVPARPFVKETVRRHAPLFQDTMSKLLTMTARGKMSTKIALDRLGKLGADKVQDTIVRSKEWAIPNADFTKAKKRSSTPLIDTGAMRQAVTFKTTMKSGTGLR